MNFAAFVVQALLVLYATRELHLTSQQIGLAFALGAFGGLLGALTAGSLARALGTGRTIALGATLYCLPFSSLAFANAGSRAVQLPARDTRNFEKAEEMEKKDVERGRRLRMR